MRGLHFPRPGQPWSSQRISRKVLQCTALGSYAQGLGFKVRRPMDSPWARKITLLWRCWVLVEGLGAGAGGGAPQ